MLKRYLDEGDARVIGIGREVQGLKRDGTTFPLHLSVGEMLVEASENSPASCTISSRVELENRLRSARRDGAPSSRLRWTRSSSSMAGDASKRSIQPRSGCSIPRGRSRRSERVVADAVAVAATSRLSGTVSA